VLKMMMVFANMAQELVSGKTLVTKQQQWNKLHPRYIYDFNMHQNLFLFHFSFYFFLPIVHDLNLQQEYF
jgi:hypothetical protein